MTWVKICGIRSVADGLAAVQAGADALGMLVGQVHASNDFISRETARAIWRALELSGVTGSTLNPLVHCDDSKNRHLNAEDQPEASGRRSGPSHPFHPGRTVVPVLVTHLSDPQAIADLARILTCQAVQVHSEQSVENLRWLRRELLPRSIIGKVGVEGTDAIELAHEMAGAVDALLLDSVDRSANRVGGTGRVHDWAISAQIVANVAVPVILAGGLTPENVCQAIQAVRPWGVDVNSGAKGPDGWKCPEKISRFVAAAKTCGK